MDVDDVEVPISGNGVPGEESVEWPTTSMDQYTRTHTPSTPQPVNNIENQIKVFLLIIFEDIVQLPWFFLLKKTISFLVKDLH